VARRRRRGLPPVPFLLAAERPGRALVRVEVRGQGRRERLAAIWDELGPLEEAAWRGALRAAGLRRLQRLRVAYAALFREAAR
jgi:hypothetical protein